MILRGSTKPSFRGRKTLLPKHGISRVIPRKPKKKQTKADFYRSWGMNPYTYIRYSGMRGVYWHYFSKWIRERDYREHGGLCMTCEKFVEKGDDQCGHFFPAANCGIDLLLYPLNNHLQHSHCNNPRFTPQAGIYNSRTITKRYGVDIIEKLEAIKGRPNQKEWGKKEYEERIHSLRNELGLPPIEHGAQI